MLSPFTTDLVAYAVLTSVLAILLAVPVIQARRSGITLPHYFVLFYGRVMARIFWRAEVRGKLNIPAGQGAIMDRPRPPSSRGTREAHYDGCVRSCARRAFFAIAE